LSSAPFLRCLRQSLTVPLLRAGDDLIEALRKSIGGTEPAKESKPAKKPRKVASSQKEMLMPITGKKPAKESAAKKPAAKPQRKSA
jgi:DNA end-binding protein Ku